MLHQGPVLVKSRHNSEEAQNQETQCSNSQMKQHHKYLHHEVLQDLHSKLVENLLPNRIIKPLLQRNIITEQEAQGFEKTQKEKGPTACSQELLEILQRDPDEDHFWLFLDCLIHTSQRELFNQLNDQFTSKASNSTTPRQITSFNDFGFKELQKSLKELYSSDTYSQVTLRPWEDESFLHIDQIYINLELQERTEYREVKSLCQYKHYTDIFSTDKNRYMVCGGPGSGKSTLSQKIVYDWATKKEKCLKEHYDLVFIVKIREFTKNSTIPNYILGGLSCKLSAQSITFIIDHHKTLFLFEGLDELQDNAADNEVIKSIKCKTWQSSHVLVTMRPHALPLVLGSPSASQNLYNVMGFDEKDFQQYIAMYFSKLKADEIAMVQKQIKELVDNTNIKNLVKIPYCALLICFVYETSKQENLPDKASCLYSEVIAAFGAVYEKKFKTEFPENYLEGLSRLAFDMLLSKEEAQLIFTDNEVKKYVDPSKACRIGILARVPTYIAKDTSKYGCATFLSFMHKSVQEYLAAKYLVKWDNITDKNIDHIKRYVGANLEYWNLDLFERFAAEISCTQRYLRKGAIQLAVQSETWRVKRRYEKDEILGNALGTYAEDMHCLLSKSSSLLINLKTLYLNDSYWLPVIQKKLQSIKVTNLVIGNGVINKGINIESIVSTSDNIKYIDLQDYLVSNISSVLVNAKMQNIEYLILMNCLSKDDMLKLLTHLGIWKQLKILDVSENYIGTDIPAPAEIQSLLISEKTSLALEKLDISECYLPPWMSELVFTILLCAPALNMVQLKKDYYQSQDIPGIYCSFASLNINTIVLILANIHKWPCVKYIDLSNNLCDDTTKPPELPNMSVYKHTAASQLEKLDMSGCETPSWLTELIISVLVSAPSLHTIKFNEYSSYSAGFICSQSSLNINTIVLILANIHKWPHIKYIDLSNNPFDSTNRPPELPDMSVYEHTTLEVQELDMSGCKAPSWIIELLVPVIRAAGKLTKLNLNKKSVNDSGLVSVLQNLYEWTHVEYIDLSDNPCVSTTKPLVLPNMSVYEHTKLKIKELNMSGCKAPSWIIEVLVHVIRAAGNMTKLNLHGNRINVPGLMSVLHNIHKWPHIKYIDLSNNPFDSTTRPPELPDMSVYEHTTLELEKLDMSGCEAPSWLMELLVHVIKVAGKLFALYLNKNIVIEELLNAIPPSIQYLSLSNCNLSTGNMIAIINRLPSWTKLMYLNFNFNPQSDPSVWKKLLEVLPKCTQRNADVYILGCEVSAEMIEKLKNCNRNVSILSW